MADEQVPAQPDQPTHPLLEKLKRAIAAHPILRDEKKLELGMRGSRVEVGGTVFTIDMHRQLVELLARVPGADEIVFTCTSQIAIPEVRALEGRVPDASDGPSPSDRWFSVRRKQ